MALTLKANGDLLGVADRNRAVVIGVLLGSGEESHLNEDLDELTRLLETLGVAVAGRVVQKRQRLSPKCLVGTGKVMEIKSLLEALCADVVVFDHSLTAPQLRNLEKMLECEVLDRTGVILEIFSRHAKTNQARTQVEIARLEYELPRMTGAWTHFQRQAGGGVRSRGMGEKQLEVDRRRARERIARLHKQLEQIQKEKRTQRKSRSKELKVALVGYTNSGKTTLMKSMTRTDVSGRNELFATLDTNIKVIDPKTRPKILLSDTVGFIKNLPHSLVDSFKSTLDEVLEADLILHVVDVAFSEYRDHIEVTESVLRDIGAAEIPAMIVFNKSDQLDDGVLPRILQSAYLDSIVVSAFSDVDVGRLRNHIFDFFKKNFRYSLLKVSSDEQQVQSLIFNTCVVRSADYSIEGVVIFEVEATPAILQRLKPWQCDELPEVEGESL